MLERSVKCRTLSDLHYIVKHCCIVKIVQIVEIIEKLILKRLDPKHCDETVQLNLC